MAIDLGASNAGEELGEVILSKPTYYKRIVVAAWHLVPELNSCSSLINRVAVDVLLTTIHNPR